MAPTHDIAIGTSSTIDPTPHSRICRRSRSHTDPKHPPPALSTERHQHLLEEGERSNNHNRSHVRRDDEQSTSTIPSTILFTTPSRDSADDMERGFAALRQEKYVKPKGGRGGNDDGRPTFLTDGFDWRTSGWEGTKWLLKLLTGQNQTMMNFLVFCASCLGIMIAISTIFGRPSLPLRGRAIQRTIVGQTTIEEAPRPTATPPLLPPVPPQYPGWQGFRYGPPTTVNNFYDCTFVTEVKAEGAVTRKSGAEETVGVKTMTTRKGAGEEVVKVEVPGTFEGGAHPVTATAEEQVPLKDSETLRRGGFREEEEILGEEGWRMRGRPVLRTMV
ncbi:hypothetical protein B0T17DRAFT_304806 [Bombardia bombarda]|uniref:Uncharacterized protein n=1 Tax=Bombardia bombarda TaxID=252184 RepID=A0AA39WUP3_9PEZI|nr:hypothetical protein B0T17DRAFT_304806 [Bombardia bombarda]